MSEIVNLNRVRKAKERVTAKTAAGENRVKFGRTKVEKAAAEHDRLKLAKVVDDAKRDPS